MSRFSDLARPLNALMRKDVEFKWMPKCQESIELLKTSLMTDPILTYPDPNLPYMLFTDASKYAWACVLTQEKTHMLEGKRNQIVAPYYLHEWIVQRKPTKFGLLEYRGFCDLYVYQEAYLLFGRW